MFIDEIDHGLEEFNIMEPDIKISLYSIAISLKRIADLMAQEE